MSGSRAGIVNSWGPATAPSGSVLPGSLGHASLEGCHWRMWQDGLVSPASQGGPGPSYHIKPTLPTPPPPSLKAKQKYSGQEAQSRQFRTSQCPSTPREPWHPKHVRPKLSRVAAHTGVWGQDVHTCNNALRFFSWRSLQASSRFKILAIVIKASDCGRFKREGTHVRLRPIHVEVRQRPA